MTQKENAMERLAAMKLEIKTLTKESKELEKDILANDPPKKVTTAVGTLTLSHRSTMKAIDNDAYISRYGLTDFRQAATITSTGIKKAHGSNRLKELDASGLLTVKSVSKFYTLR